MTARRCARALLATVAFLATIVYVVPSEAARARVPGIAVAHLRLRGPVRVVVVHVDPSVVRLVPVLATDRIVGYGKLPGVAARHHAMVAINGDLATQGRPAHAIVHDGEVLTSGGVEGAVIALSPDGTRASVTFPRTRVLATRLDTGQPVAIARWNAGPAPGDAMAAFTTAYGRPEWSAARVCFARLTATVAGPTLQRFRVGEAGCRAPDTALHGDDILLVASAGGQAGRWLAALRPGVVVGTKPELGLPAVDQAFGGAPLLVHHGRVVREPCTPLRCDLHPRSGVGITRGCMDIDDTSPCRALLVTVDGRRAGWSVGMTTTRFARTMLRLGAYEAINLDGGASTQLLREGVTLNRPAPGARRAVVNALIVQSRPQMTQNPRWR
jgi:hypothetical protein